MGLQELYSQFHPLLFSIAYRMLGTVSDAEDIVHDVYVKASERTIDHVENKKAYLCKMVTNKCIDHLTSAEHKREVYIGPWLPEPLILNENDPVSEVMNEEAVSFAILLLMEKLKPLERAVFILREVLDYDYATISQILNRSESTCRKVFSRVKTKFPLIEEEVEAALDPKRDGIIQTFVLALHHGNFQKIEELLYKDVTLYSDGGGKVYAALKPVFSRDLVVRFIRNLLSHKHNEEKPAVVKVVNVNGQTGLLVRGEDNIKTVICFHVKNDQIADIYIVRNPEKLKHVSLQSH
ncbi:RNA polymerase sigma-70 factor [Neobacillus sp. PS3-34]|uniref:RNA polymerase sigma-70 factor n=1 Tax=Neobacillus sp. PS3-34 TaxID=3070678 RepID=UPI0027E19B62|nr:RNA polymerase sigma-70 factor [Neobacillus sp. PS3-34]WML48706.1 RNA polymerase sigma-70 factor [Neobacillus sp. PS3-34]